ncbi:MAG: hypothetical protein OEW59_08750, partial [Gammaproteobacteria bacterium]|nr:hypothetical protein [Gammaproteobacteria bacterium]
ARRTVSNAGFVDRAEFLNENSFRVALPERVDVVICDHVGCFGFDYGALETLVDAKDRFLKPGGLIVPASITLMLAPVDSDYCRALVGQWLDRVPAEYRWVAESAANTKHLVEHNPDAVVAEPVTLGSLVLGDDAAPYYSWKASFRATRDSDLDGIAGWFECRLFDDVTMTNSPLADERMNRPQAFLPLGESVAVSKGDPIEVTIMARPADNVIGWIVDLPSLGRKFAHNTFNGLQLDEDMLARVRVDRVAKLNDQGRARQIVFTYCDGQRTVAEVLALVEREHPDLFPSAQATVSFVRSVLAKDTGR